MAEEQDNICNLSSDSWELWLINFIILLGLLVLFIWLGIRPKNPNYTVTDFSVQNGTIPFAIEFVNPNKESDVHYADINITCYYRDQILGSNLIPSFSQDGGDTTSKNGLISAGDKARKQLEAEIPKGGTRLEVTLMTKIRYQTWGIKSPRQKVRQGGELPVGPDGKMPGKNKLKKSKKWSISML